MSLLKVINQLGVLGSAHVARPDDLCPIDIGLIVNPLMKRYLVARTVADNHELASRALLEPGQQVRTLEVTGSAGLREMQGVGDEYSDREQYQADRGNGSRDEQASWLAAPLVRPQPAQGLHDQGQNRTGDRRGVMRQEPYRQHGPYNACPGGQQQETGVRADTLP